MLGRILDALSLVGLALPNFWLGLMLIGWFAVGLRLFPASGYVPPSGGLNNWATSLVLPVVTLAAPGVAVIAEPDPRLHARVPCSGRSCGPCARPACPAGPCC